MFHFDNCENLQPIAATGCGAAAAMSRPKSADAERRARGRAEAARLQARGRFSIIVRSPEALLGTPRTFKIGDFSKTI